MRICFLQIFLRLKNNDQVLQSVDYWPENLDPLICKEKQKTTKAPKVH